MSEDVVIQRVFPDDWQVFARVRLAALHEAPQAFGSRYETWAAAPEDQWRERLTTVAATWVARRGEDGIGVISGALPEPGRAELISMWVAPAERGRGLSDRLVGTMLEWARSQPGLAQVELDVYEHNIGAQKLYQRNGFSFSTPETGQPDAEFRMVLKL